MSLPLIYAVAASVATGAPPAEVISIHFLEAVSAGRFSRARALLTTEPRISDTRNSSIADFSLEALRLYIRGCGRRSLTRQSDPKFPDILFVASRWNCPGRPDARVFLQVKNGSVDVAQYGPPPVVYVPPELRKPEPVK